MRKIVVTTVTLCFFAAAISIFLSEDTGAVATSSNYKIWVEDVNAGGSDNQTSTSYKMSETIGGFAPGESDSSNYKMKAGYRQMTAQFSLSISSPSNVDMGSIPGITGGSATGETSWTVITDNPAGYSLSVKSSTSAALQGQAQGDSFTDYTEANSGTPDYDWSVDDSTAEFGFTPEGSHIVSKFKDNGSDACNTGSSNTADKCWYHFSDSNETIGSSYSANHVSGTATTLKFKAELYNADGVPNNDAGILIEDTYQATITITALAN